MKPTSKVKFKLHIELTDEFAKVFSNQDMDEVRKINAEDVLKKAADSFFTERGYSAKNLDISVKTQSPKKEKKQTGPRPRNTSFDHIFEERARREAEKAGNNKGQPTVNGKTNGATPPANDSSSPNTIQPNSKPTSGEQPFPG